MASAFVWLTKPFLGQGLGAWVATRTKSGLLLPMVVVAVVVVIFGGDRLIGGADRLIGRLIGGTKIVGEGGAQIMVAADTAPRAEQCSVQQMLDERRCGDLKVVIMDASKMPFITRNISMAWTEGKPGILTKNKSKEHANRAVACPDNWPKKYPELSSCDEYAFAGTDQGGANARTEEVPRRENLCQGGTLRWEYAKARVAEGDAFLVVITNPQLIAKAPFAGNEIAKDQTCSG